MHAPRYLVAAALAASVTAISAVVGQGTLESARGLGGLRGPPTSGPSAGGPAVMALAAPTPGEPASGPAYGTYAWPVRGPVLRPYDPPETPYGSGHRGIDIGAVLGTSVVAAHDGVVAFAGPIAGNLFVSIDHPDGVRTTYSWLSEVTVRRGEAVRKGDPIGRAGPGHPGSGRPHLHLGARVGDMYLDPMLLLEQGSLVGLVHLAPLPDERPARSERPA
jgi:murein DD-endopeptidase MepM/ murein hydrolase activator NlpD